MTLARKSPSHVTKAALDPHNSPPGSKTYRLGYRADIEGLRALAILLVVAHHAGVSWLGGGFVGVDVFFVISGYLITGLLLQEIRSTGRLDLLEFYSRRLRRLLPALLFMVACTMLASAILLAPLEQLAQAETARSASVWVSNFFLAFSDFGYFAPAANTNLFLHTWSLGVEEQFYLAWPLLLMFLLGAWQWQGGARSITRLSYGLIAVVGLSLGLAIFLSFTNPIWGFYLAPPRAWQFALGAMALLWSTGHESNSGTIDDLRFPQRHPRLALVSGWLGLSLILISAVFLRTDISYPGAWALIPSVGAVLVLSAGSTAATSVSRLLSIFPMQAIGRVSYSWYLWHWPVLVLGATMLVVDDLSHRIGLLGISLAIAVFSYFAVESPIRRNKILAKRPRFTLAASGALMAIAVAGGIGWQQMASSWSELPTQKQYQEVRGDLPIIYAMGCDEWFNSSQVRICAFGNQKAQKTAVLIGDSIMGQWFPAVAQAYNKPDWRVLVLTKSACPMVDEPIFYQRIGMEYTVCSRWRDEALATLRLIRPNVVVMGGASTYDFNADQWMSGTRRVLEKIAPFTGHVFIVMGTYRLPFDGPGCLARQDWRPSVLAGPDDCSAPAGNRQETEIKAWMNQAAAGFPNVAVLDPNPLVCPEGRCYAKRGGAIVFRDTQHLTARYTKSLGDELARKMMVQERKL